MLQLTDRIFYASPDDDTITPFLKFIGSATKSIHIADYSFNMKELIPVLIGLRKEGIDIEVVLDKSQSSGASEAIDIQQLREAGISITIGTSDKHQIMHNKIAIIDGTRVLYGSWNFTDTAAREDNIYVIDSNTEVAVWAEQLFQNIKSWIISNEPQ